MMKAMPTINKTSSAIFDLSNIPLDQVAIKIKECFEGLLAYGSIELKNSDVKVLERLFVTALLGRIRGHYHAWSIRY
jgi:hypothetical protein